jgi:hypothetical protein
VEILTAQPRVVMPTVVVAQVSVVAQATDSQAAPARIRSSADSSHNMYADAVAQKNLTSYHVSSTHTVTVELF